MKRILSIAPPLDECLALARLMWQRGRKKKGKGSFEEQAALTKQTDFCYLALDRVSRSFAAVIRQLPNPLRDPVCIFYLVLRGLDSIEDDMNIALPVRLDLLRHFHEKNYDPNWSVSGMGDSPDYQVLLNNYHKVSRSFLQLDPIYQEVITEICRDMGEGMAKYAEQEIQTLEDFDNYCHYVAGLVGIGLSGLFSAAGTEAPELQLEKRLSNSMGLFLQKTNIIRDYLEDLYSYRTFWPRSVWVRYADHLGYFASHPDSGRSTACLNHLITDALRHVPDCIEYLSLLRNERVFRFCAIPQVMAIATLAELYDNRRVFEGVVKIRRSLAAKLIYTTKNLKQVKGGFEFFGDQIFRKITLDDPNSSLLVKRLQALQKSVGKGPLIAIPGSSLSESPEKINA